MKQVREGGRRGGNAENKDLEKQGFVNRTERWRDGGFACSVVNKCKKYQKLCIKT